MYIEENSIEAKLADAINKEVSTYTEKLLDSIKTHGKFYIGPDGISLLVSFDDAEKPNIPAPADDFCKFTPTSDFISHINAEYEEENEYFDTEDKLDYIERTLEALHSIETTLRVKQKELKNRMEK